MDRKLAFDKDSGHPENATIVYVRPMDVGELPDELRAQADGLDQIYGLFGPNGEQIAFTANKSLAFDLAKENSLTPMSVH